MIRVLLVLPSATYRAAAFIDAAKRLGVDVVTASDQQQALASSMGDRFILVPLERPEEATRRIVSFASRKPLDAVVAVDDQGSLVASMASEALGLLHSPPTSIRATRDKVEMRRLFALAEVPQPSFVVVEHDLRKRSSVATGAAAAAAGERLGFPVVVKPASLSGSRGVIRADDPAGARACAERIVGIVEDAGEVGVTKLLVETFFPGDEVTVEGIVRAGKVEILAVFDKPDPLDGPYFEETIYVTPSRHDVGVLVELGRVVQRAVDALGLTEGPVHAEARIAKADPREVVVLEVAARTIGGRCSNALELADGSSLEEVVLRHALGLGPKAQAGGADRPDEVASHVTERLPAMAVMMLPIPVTGRLESVEGIEAALEVPFVTGCEITVAPGRRVRTLPEGDRYLGFLFSRAPTPELAEGALRTAHKALHVRIAS